VPIGAIIGGGLGLVGGLLGGNAAKKAAKAQARAAQAALDAQREMFDISREDLMPYSDVGKQGLYSLASLYGLKNPNLPEGGEAFNPAALEAFRRSPDYQVALQEGVGALDKSAAARGNLLSSGHIRRITDYASNIAASRFGNYMDRLMALAGIGENAAARTGAAAIQTGQGLAGTNLALGEAQAGGIVGQANAINQGLQGLGNNLAYYAFRQNPGALGAYS
jgi:hypothetical protein